VTKREKRFKKALNNPKTVSFETLDNILLNQGFERRQPNSGSSHYTYTKQDIIVTMPYKRPFIKPVYVKRVLELIGENHEK
jgi:hypothetical protein